MTPRLARLTPLPALAFLALASPATPAPPPVLASKALRVELSGTAEALWRFVPRSGAPALAFAAPVFPLDGRRVVAALESVARVGDPVVLPNGVFEHTFRGTLRDDPSLALEIRFRLSEDGPILRFAYRLTSTRPRAFTRSGPEDELAYFGTSFAGLPEAREVRLSEFVELLHSYTLSERDVPDAHFEAGLSAMGPILAATDRKRTLLLAYEHGSQAPDAFLRFDLAPGRKATLRAVKGSYWQGLTVDAAHPYDTPWMQAGLVAGDLDWTAEAYRAFVRTELTQNAETRAPRVHYNTWNFQERNKHWNGKPYLESMNAARMAAEIDVAARMGIETFVLDTGWYEKTGDWAVSRARFPQGLAPLKAKLDAHNMKLGLWFNPNAAAVSSRVGSENQAYRMSWKGESKASPIWETEESYPMCLVSPWGEAFLKELVRLHRETGVTYYKWDAVGQYGCDAPGHGHGSAANTPEERADAYAFRIGLRLAEIAEKLGEQVPGAVVDFDVTEGGRAVGLAFLSAGRYFLVNNGPYFQNYDVPIDPAKDNWNLFFHKGAARTWITRSTYGYDKWIPSELFLTHYFPDDPEDAQLVGIGSLILGHNGIWGDLLTVSPGGVARFGTLLGLWRQVRESMAVASPVRQGAVGGSGEVHEKIEHETGRGAIVIFSTVRGRQRYVSEHPVVREHWATAGTSVTFDAQGRAVVDAAFERPGAAIVFFGAREEGLAAAPAWAQAPEANYEEAKVPAYALPDPLRLANGTAVTDAAAWRQQRRPELLRLFEESVYGRSPGPPAGMRFVVVESDPRALGGLATRKQVRVLLDGSESGPAFEILLYVPNGARRPVPAFLGLNFDGNHAVHPDPGIRLSTAWMDEGPGVAGNRATEAARGMNAASWPVERILDRGYALATVYYGDLEPDHPDGWKDGVRARIGPGSAGRFAPDDWGAIGAWAWGLSRALDFLLTDADVDGRKVAVIGHSRLGKSALWAGASDERFAMVVSNDSGEGGAALARRRFGETTARITSTFPHWFAPRLAEYAGREDALPVDQHELLALVAPRPLYVASATEDLWADPRGEFLAAKAAGPVYALLGHPGLGVEEMPAPDRPVGGSIGYHLRTGKHALAAYDWEQYLEFADRHLRGAR